MSYSWDARGRLASVKVYSSCTNYTSGNYQLVTYSYDMFNNLIGRTVNGVAQYFVYDGTNMVLAFNGSDNLTDRYLSGPAVDQVLADEYFPSPTSQLPSAAGTTLWMLGDNQGSVTDVVGDSGTPYEHIDYSPFGVQNVTVENTPPTGYVLPFGYTGTYTDPTTGYQLHGEPLVRPGQSALAEPGPERAQRGTKPVRVLRERADGWDRSERVEGAAATGTLPLNTGVPQTTGVPISLPGARRCLEHNVGERELGRRPSDGLGLR